MRARELVVDGNLSGTGIRDALNGGYLNPREIGLSSALSQRIEEWVANYEVEHYAGYKNLHRNNQLDGDGIEIAKLVKCELPKSKVQYFSSASMQKIWIK